MKNTVRPSPFKAILFGAGTIICAGDMIADAVKNYSLSAGNALLTLLVAGVFVWTLVDFCSQKKIEFDESSFTVGGKTYDFSEITKVGVNSELIFRYTSTLKIELYVNEDKVCSFMKSDPGAGDFIYIVKNKAKGIDIDL